MDQRKFNRYLCFVLTSFLVAFVVLSSKPDRLVAQEKCRGALEKAEQEYVSGQFDNAISLLEICLGAGAFSDNEREHAYKFLGLAYLAKDYLDQAKAAVYKLLLIVPNWEYDPVQDPPQFQKIVDEVRKELQRQQSESERPEKQEQISSSPKKRGKTWLLIGAAAVAAGGVVFLVSTGGTSDVSSTTGFPLPPGRPQ